MAVSEKPALSNPSGLTNLVLKTFKVCLKCQASVTQKVGWWSVLPLVITHLAQSSHDISVLTIGGVLLTLIQGKEITHKSDEPNHYRTLRGMFEMPRTVFLVLSWMIVSAAPPWVMRWVYMSGSRMHRLGGAYERSQLLSTDLPTECLRLILSWAFISIHDGIRAGKSASSVMGWENRQLNSLVSLPCCCCYIH